MLTLTELGQNALDEALKALDDLVIAANALREWAVDNFDATVHDDPRQAIFVVSTLLTTDHQIQLSKALKLLLEGTLEEQKKAAALGSLIYLISRRKETNND